MKKQINTRTMILAAMFLALAYVLPWLAVINALSGIIVQIILIPILVMMML